MEERHTKPERKAPLTVGDYIKRKQQSWPSLLAVIAAALAILSAAIAIMIQYQMLEKAFGFITTVFQVEINKHALQEAFYMTALVLTIIAAVLVAASFFMYRQVLPSNELKRRILEIVIKAPNQHIITKDTLMSIISLKVRRTKNVVAVTSGNLYLSELTWNTPEVLRFVGAKVAMVSGETLFLGYGKDKEEATQAVYSRAEKAVKP